jgi:predicted phage terminase large subunit-like protein
VQVEELRALADKSLTDTNYQYRDLSLDEIDKKAKASFGRLTQEQQEKVVNVCTEYKVLNTETPESDAKSFKEMKRWRFLAQTNLFFLCQLLEKYKDVSEREYTFTDGTTHNTHEEICNEFFVRKDPTVKSFKIFAKGYTSLKERLLLVPRGGFKSSIDMADTVQWLICWPETTVMILTGVLDLAKDFVIETKGHFELEDGGVDGLFYPEKALKPRSTYEGSYNLFQVLFPEHCIPKEEGKATEFQTPAAPVVEKECSVFAASIDQNLSGWHVGVMKLDDVVTNENSRTIDRIRNVNKQVSINNAMLHPYGFYDKIGTWYDAEDTYGQDMKFVNKCIASGEPLKKKVYLRAAWWPNKEAILAGKIEEEMVASDWVLWFPEEGQLTYEFLRGKKLEDPEGFAIKYLNDPTQVHRVKFPRELLIRRTIHSNLLPQQGLIVTTVDTAYSTKSWADYTVIITALIYGGRFYIIDMKRGRYNEYELPIMIALTAQQWKPKRICIEESTGVKWLGKEVYKEMAKLGVRVSIEFVPLGQGNKNINSKQVKAKPVLRYLGDERLFFANQCVGLEELYNELEKFGTGADLHDDIVSALSILVDQFASYADAEGCRTSAQSDFVIDSKTKQQYDHIYGDGVFAKLVAQKNYTATLEEDVPSSQNGQMWSQSDHDPLSDVCG